jgi:hypothetical protein
MINMSPKKRLIVVLGILIVMMVSMTLLTRFLERATENYKENKRSGVHYPTVESAKWVTQIESLCILVEQNYEGISNHKEPIAEELQGILERIGIKSNIGEGDNCDATLDISISVKPISEHVSGAGSCYLSASAEGEARLSARGHKTIKLALKKPPPDRSGFGIQIVSNCPRTPAETPLTNTWVTAVSPVLKWWGAPALVSALQSEIPEFRWVVSHQFNSLGAAGEEAIPSLTEMLTDPNPLLSSAAVQAIGDLGTNAASAVPAMIEAYQYAESTSQYAFLRALGQIKDKRALPLLTSALHDDWYIAHEAALALGNMGGAAESAVPDLIPLLYSTEHQLVTATVETLGKIGEPAMQAVPDLIKLIDGTENSYFYWVEHALKAITGQDLGKSADAWQKWWDAQ